MTSKEKPHFALKKSAVENYPAVTHNSCCCTSLPGTCGNTDYWPQTTTTTNRDLQPTPPWTVSCALEILFAFSASVFFASPPPPEAGASSRQRPTRILYSAERGGVHGSWKHSFRDILRAENILLALDKNLQKNERSMAEASRLLKSRTS